MAKTVAQNAASVIRAVGSQHRDVFLRSATKLTIMPTERPHQEDAPADPTGNGGQTQDHHRRVHRDDSGPQIRHRWSARDESRDNDYLAQAFTKVEVGPQGTGCWSYAILHPCMQSRDPLHQSPPRREWALCATAVGRTGLATHHFPLPGSHSTLSPATIRRLLEGRGLPSANAICWPMFDVSCCHT